MSSTHRGAVRQPDDYYATPAWCVESVLPRLRPDRSMVVLDPAAGEGAILSAVLAYEGSFITKAIELNPERAKICQEVAHVRTGDALTMIWPPADLILANPPFSLALEFVRLACHHLRLWGGGKAAFLLRLAFLESKERNTFLRGRMPDEIYVLPRRPSFVGGKTDSCAYAWFVWGPEAHGEAAKISVLESQNA